MQIKKQKCKEDKQNVSSEHIREKLNEKFSKLDMGKRQVEQNLNEKVGKIFERRNNKDSVKEKLLNDKQIGHKMLKEVHNLRYSNA